MMHQHFHVEVFTDCVKTTSLFKTAPLKSLKVHPRFVPSPKIIIYVLTFPLMYCPKQPILQRHRRAPALPSSPVTIQVRQGRSWEQTHKKKEKNPTTTWPCDSCTLRAPEGPTILNHCVITEIRGSRGQSISERLRLHMHGWGGPEEESRLEQSSCKLKQLDSICQMCHMCFLAWGPSTRADWDQTWALTHWAGNKQYSTSRSFPRTS